MKRKIHLVIEPALLGDRVRMSQLRDLIIERYDLGNLNEARYERFGIISGDVDPGVIDKLRTLEGLSSVSVDDVKYAT